MLMLTVTLTGVISTLPFLIPYNIRHKLAVKHTLIVYLFVYYLAGVLIITQIPSIRDVFHNNFGIMYPRVLNTPPKYNLIPFRWIAEGVRPYIENILLFIPFGFMLPCIWTKYEELWKTALTGAALSLIIELSQLFDGRVADIDDLLMNTIGVFIGWVIFILLKERLSKVRVKISALNTDVEKIPRMLRAEATFYMAGTFAGIFVFFPFLRSLF